MRLRRSVPVGLLLLLAALGAGPARAGDSLLVLRSEPGDPLGSGQTLVFRPSGSTFMTQSNVRHGLDFHFRGPGHNWTVVAQAGRWRWIAPGVYGPAGDVFAAGDTLPMLEVYGDGRGCEDLGYFDVRQIAYDGGGVVRRLRMVFEHHCDGASAAMTGELRVDADTTITVQAPLRARARRGQSLSVDITATHAGGLPLALSASSLPAGAAFADHGGGAGTLTWTPALDQQGDFAIAFTAADGQGKSENAHTMVRVDGDTLVDIVSEAGDRSWLGRSCRLRPGDVRVIAQSHDYSACSLNLYPQNPTVGTRYFYVSAPTLQYLREGNYSWLRRWSDVAYAGGSFVASPAPGSCGAVESHFRVRRLETSRPDTLSAVWVEWEQHCDGDGPAFRGEIRINAGSPVVVYAPIARRVHDGDTLRFTVSARDTLGRALTLSAGQLPSGSSFVSTGPTSGEFSWTPADAQRGAYTVLFIALNSAGQADTVGTDIVVTGDVSASIVSEPGDPAGGGAACAYTGGPGMLLTTALVSNGFGTSDAVDLYEPGQSWGIRLCTQPMVPIQVGRYQITYPAVDNGPGFYAFNSLVEPSTLWRTVDFNVRQVERTGNGDARRLWLEFEQRTNGATPILRGEIRLDARWRVLARAPLRLQASWNRPATTDVRGLTPDGRIPALSVIGLPPHASFEPILPGLARFTWLPRASDVGVPRIVGFIATRQDGTADTAWTALDALPRGTFHLEEDDKAWDLDSDLGDFRVYGSPTWATVAFSSQAADTLWAIDVGIGPGDTLRTGSWIKEDPYSGRPLICVYRPGDWWSECSRDTGRLEIDQVSLRPDGVAATLWAALAHRGSALSHAGRLALGPGTVLGAPPVTLPEIFGCSGFEPNPLSRSSRLRLALPRAGTVELALFDVAGRRVLAQRWSLEAGHHDLRPPALDALAPGLYFTRVTYEGRGTIRRMTVVR